jgi:hypothetical protein
VLTTLVLAIAGCQNSVPSEAGESNTQRATDSEKVKPEDALAESLRAGSFQAGAAVDSIAEADGALKKLIAKTDAEIRSALDEAAEILASAAEGLTDAAAEAPTVEQVTQDFQAADDARLKRIDSASDALVELRLVHGSLDSLSEDLGSAFTKEIQDIVDLVSVAEDDAAGAVQAFGGELPAEETEEPTSSAPRP